MKKTATQSEIRSRYRELSKKWHPDKYQSEEDKEEANARYLIYDIFLKYKFTIKYASILELINNGSIFNCRFVEIQAAYEKLSDIKNKRSVINRRHEEE